MSVSATIQHCIAPLPILFPTQNTMQTPSQITTDHLSFSSPKLSHIIQAKPARQADKQETLASERKCLGCDWLRRSNPWGVEFRINERGAESAHQTFATMNAMANEVKNRVLYCMVVLLRVRDRGRNTWRRYCDSYLVLGYGSELRRLANLKH
jgi:hypothetical protein